MKGRFVMIKKMMVFAMMVLPMILSASTCVEVKVDIPQEASFERQAFEAKMKITNSGADMTKVGVTVNYVDKDGKPVQFSTDPNEVDSPSAPEIKFFMREDRKSGVDRVDGQGTIADGATAEIVWLIIPTPGAANTSPEGEAYGIGVTLNYEAGGEAKSLTLEPDYIHVKPMPELSAEYFLPMTVHGDDPFTTNIEEENPFYLGVRMINSGYGDAKSFKIASAQPKIVKNDQGAAIGFKLHSCEINDKPAKPVLTADFGTIPAGGISSARWTMTTSLSGEFTEFSASYSHSDELGGQLTSLLKSVKTYRLIRDVKVAGSGYDGVRDFLALDESSSEIKLFESTKAAADLVTDQSGSFSYDNGIANKPFKSGYSYAKTDFIPGGGKVLDRVVRDDGVVINPENIWISKEMKKDGEEWNGDWNYFLHIFDYGVAGSRTEGNTVRYNVALKDPVMENKPVLQFMSDITVDQGKDANLFVNSSMTVSGHAKLSVDALPGGADFTDNGDGTGNFNWTPSFAGVYKVTFNAVYGKLVSSRTVTITVLATDAPAVEFASASSTVSEDSGVVAVKLKLNNRSAKKVKVYCTLLGGTATTNEDFIIKPQAVEFDAMAFEQTFNLTIKSDWLEEDDETIILGISNPENAKLGSVFQHTITISNDDGEGLLLAAKERSIIKFASDFASGSADDDFIVTDGAVKSFTHGADGYVYVSQLNVVSRYDAKTGMRVDDFIDCPELVEAGKVVFDPFGKLYVSDTLNNTILRFNSDGSFDKTILDDSSVDVTDFVFDKAGQLVICDKTNARVTAHHPETGVLVSTISDDAGLTSPVSVNFDKDDSIYVVSRSGNAIYKLASDGSIAQTYTGKGTLVEPSAMSFAVNGNIYVSDASSNGIVEINPADDSVVSVHGSDLAIARSTDMSVSDLLVKVTDQPTVANLLTEGDDVTLSVRATGTESLFYQWLKNGVEIDDAVYRELSLTDIPVGDDQAEYQCRIESYTGNVKSNLVTLNVNPAVEALADSYTTDEDSPLNIAAAAGVLANDTQAESAVLVANVDSAKGSLIFNADGSFTFTPVQDFNGMATFTYKAVKGASETAETTVTITVTAVDDAPVISSPLADVNVDEDAADKLVSLSGLGTDVDNDDSAIVYTVSNNSNSSLLSVVLSGSQITLSLVADANGSADITVTAASNGKTVSDTFTVNVAAVDDAPVVANTVNEVAVLENAANTVIDLTNVFTDIDSDDSAIVKTVSVDNSSLLTATVNGDTLTLDYLPEQAGSAVVTITGTVDGQSVSTHFNVVVTPVYTVTFDLDGKGTSSDALIQQIVSGQAAAAPAVTADTGWGFTGWDVDYSAVSSDMTVTAQYDALALIFPDANFKQALIDAGIDTNSDGELTIPEMNSTTGTLNFANKGLTSIDFVEHLTGITYLYLNDNSLTNLPAGIGKLTNLRYLYVHKNQLTSLPAEIGSLSSLQRLYAYNNKLSALPAEVGDLSNLLYLYVASNQLVALPDSVCNLSKLIYMNVSYNRLDAMPDNIGNLGNLITFYIRNNKISTIPPSIDGLDNLNRFEIQYNKLTQLPPEIGGLDSLKVFRVYDNLLTSIPVELCGVTSLENLQIDANKITSLPSEIGNLTNLTRLEIYENQLTHFPEEICSLTKLVYLYAHKNPFNCDLPSSLGNLTKLQELLIWDCGVKSIPPEIGALSKLKSLSMSDNNLTALPVEIFNLTNLEVLYFHANSLSTIPNGLSNLTKLKQLSISSNQFGAIPSEVFSLTNLTHLYAKEIGMTELPSEIGTLTNLDVFSASMNQLTSVPIELFDLINLTELYLYSNKLSQLPPEITNLTNLSTLYLYDNELTDISPLTSPFINGISKVRMENNYFAPVLGSDDYSVLSAITNSAVYTPQKQIAVSFDMGGKATNIVSQTVYYSNVYTLPTPEVNSGWEFKGWDSDNDGNVDTLSGSTFNLETVVPNSSITFVAKYERINNAPVATDMTANIPENGDAGEIVCTVDATDGDVGDILSYEIISGNDSNLFSIDQNGEITTTSSLDYETSTQHVLTVKVTDLGGLTDSCTVTINVLDSTNEDSDDDGVSDALEIAYGTDHLNPNSTPVAEAPQVLPAAVTFTAEGAVNGAVDYVVSKEGVTMTIVPYSADTSVDTIGYSDPTIGVTGGSLGGRKKSHTVCVDEALEISFDQDVLLNEFVTGNVTSGEISSLTSAAFDGLSGVVGGTYDDDADAITTKTGQGVMTFDDGNAYTGIFIPKGTVIEFTVPVGSVSYRSITVTPLNSVTVYEDIVVGTTVTTVEATDVEPNEQFSYAITAGNESGLFSIDSSGNIVTTDALDSMVTPQHLLTVEVTDMTGLSVTTLVVVEVLYYNEVLTFTDSNFKQALIDKGADSNSNGELTIGELNALTGTLNLSNKNLTDVTNIRFLNSITHLYIDHNKLRHLSSEVCSLNKLVYLNADFNNLIRLPSSVDKLVSLESLHVSENSLRALPAEICKLSKLINLYAFNNSIAYIPTNIGNLLNLEKLYLHKNKITELPVSIGSLTKLLTLSLSWNQLSTVPSEIGNLVHLEIIYLHTNKLVSVPPEIGNLTNLWDLQLYNNQLSEVPVEIGNLSNLGRLYLNSNKLTSIPAEIGNLTKLYKFSVDSNRLTSLPNQISQLVELKELYLGNNELTSLPEWVGNFNVLEILSIWNNKISSLPKELGLINTLKVLSASYNELNHIPKEVCLLPNLETFYIHSNELTSIPPEVSNLKKLNSFSVKDNKLTSLPPEIGTLTNLDVFSASMNQLTSVPIELFDLINLTELYLYSNKLSQLPPEITNLTNLSTLYLYDNELTDISPLTSPFINGISKVRMENNYFAPVLGSDDYAVLSAVTNAAVYTPQKQIAVSFDMGGKATNIVSQTVYYSDVYSLPTPEVNSGWAFRGWDSDNDGVVDVAPGLTFDLETVVPNSSITFVAKYQEVINLAPVAADDSAVVDKDGSVVVSVIGNDTDPNSDPLIVSAVTQGTNGIVTIKGTTVTYTPVPNFNGMDTFTYTITDGELSDTATVSVTVNSVVDLAVVSTSVATSIDVNSVTANYAVTSTGDEDPTITLYYGLTDEGQTERWSNSVVIGSQSVGSFNSALSGLIDNMNYFYTIKAVNSAGTAWGGTQSFTTLKDATPKLYRTTTAAVGTDKWVRVTVPNYYHSMVVVAAPRVADQNNAPLVTRVTNVGHRSFDLIVQRADNGSAVFAAVDVDVMVVEEGSYTAANCGVDMEAYKYTSTTTTYKNNYAIDQITPVNTYTSPVVLGQVMSFNDSRWSVFWACDGTHTNVPSASSIYIGKSVGEDPDTSRNDETLGYIIIESGGTTVNGIALETGVSSQTIGGMDNDASGYSYSLSGSLSSASCAVLSVNSYKDDDQGIPVLYGAAPVLPAALTLIFDEDQKFDSERSHGLEAVSYIVFE